MKKSQPFDCCFEGLRIDVDNLSSKVDKNIVLCYNIKLLNAPVAQGIEQRTSNPLVVRSIRTRRAIVKSTF